MGMIVNDFLVDNFPNIIDYSFTAKIEQQFDNISQGIIEWDKMLSEFYADFHPQVQVSATVKTKGKVREIGTDPSTGKKVLARMARFGPIVQIGENGDNDKPKFASLKKDQRIETITLSEALELFKLPREVGIFESKPIIAGIGKFGPYIRHDNKFYSISKDDDAETISPEKAIELIEEKRISDARRSIKTFDEDPNAQILNGRWGPYIKFGNKNVKIPRGTVPESLTYADCKKLAEEVDSRKKRKK
jgi:DNA topoisomerase-1